MSAPTKRTKRPKRLVLTPIEATTLRKYIAHLEDPARTRDAAFWTLWKKNPTWKKVARRLTAEPVRSAPPKDWIITLRMASVPHHPLQQLVFDHDEYGLDVVLIRDLRFGSEGRAIITRVETGAKEMLAALRRPSVQAGHAPDCAGCFAPHGSGVPHTATPTSPVKKGDKVRLSKSLKDRMRANGSVAHAREFEHSVGVVLGLTDYNYRGAPLDTSKIGPEVDVRWESGLRYAYPPNDLEVVK
jgi:hypothetical protein